MALPPSTSPAPAECRNDRRHRAAAHFALALLAGLLAMPAAGRGNKPFVADHPPVASHIVVGTPGSDHIVTLTGAAGAVLPNSHLLLINLDTGHFAGTQASGSGGFSASLYGPPGTSILIKVDPAGVILPGYVETGGPAANDPANPLQPMPGTILRVSDQQANDPNIFGGAGTVQVGALPAWTFAGRTSGRQLAPGGTLEVTGTLIVESTVAIPSRTLQIGLMLERLSTPAGDPVLSSSTFASSTLTPTGLAIERLPDWFNGLHAQRLHTLTPAGPGRLGTGVEVSLELPSDLLPGYYVPCLIFYFEAQTTPGVVASIRDFANRRPLETAIFGPVVRLGSPAAPRIAWTLLNDELINGTRGVTALEHRGKFALATRIRSQTDYAIVPRVSAETGQPLTYRLEPFAPTISVGDRGAIPNPPMIPFRFPSGQLEVTVEGPDGSRQSVGPFPFVQARVRGAGNAPGTPYEFGSSLTDVYQLSTMQPALEWTFAEEGAHRIIVKGWIEDIWGNRWDGSGTYDIRVGRVLTLQPAVFPTAPFIVGDSINLAGSISPPVPADVEVRYSLSTGKTAEPLTVRTFHGRANRFGYYSLGESISLPLAGEYRLDVAARYEAPAGSWYGGRTWGGVVAPATSAIVAHGRRGVANQTSDRAQWLVRADVEGSGTLPPGQGAGFIAPFHSGDVLWMADDLEGAAAITLSFQDTSGTLLPLFTSRCRPCPVLSPPPGDFASRAAVGEIPLFSRRPDYVDPHVDPSKVDLWAYSYRGVQRPALGIRELVVEDSMFSTNWYVLDRYGWQLGNGGDGDRANDVKFMFGGVVIRGSAVAAPSYAAYGSLFVVTGEGQHEADRTMPPFQGNGGGPSGGPLMTLKGRAIDLFWLPTAVRPGTILEIGNKVSFAGQFGPMLPCKLELIVTAPSGKVRTLNRQANKIGYLYDPDFDFYADEPGLWKVRVRGSFDGITSAGQVTAPFPTGDVLGTADGEYSFYVVRRDAPPLGVDKPAASFTRPAEGAIPFALTNPAGASATKLHHTTTMPGFLLEHGQLSGLDYSYDAPSIAQDFPNLDLLDVDGKAGVDLVTLSFLAAGKDGAGADLFRARQLLLQGEELLNPPQDPAPPCANTDTSLCLAGGRYRLTARWRTPQGASGVGHAVPLTQDTGYFWFFRPENVEVITKVLNACGFPASPRYWVFASGLTNVEVTLEVEDTATGEVRFYDNPLGQAFLPLQDTDAFPTCGAPAGARGDFSVVPAPRSFAALRMTASGAGAAAPAGDCAPGPTALCLAGGRFRVEATWRTADGRSGAGLAVPLTLDTGYFWFFRPDNVEVITKVLDACSFAQAPRFWTFAAGLTNVEVKLKVADTQTGQVREYKNPLGKPFKPIQDTNAFTTCP